MVLHERRRQPFDQMKSPVRHSQPPRHRIGSRRRHKRVWLRRTLIGLNVLVLVCIVAMGIAFYYVHYRYSQIHKVTVHNLRTPTVNPSGGPQTILLVGNNTRCALNGQQANAFGTCGEVGGERSDVTMLLHVDPQTTQVSVLSIPRDLWLPVPGTKDQLRVDAALNKGPSFLVETIEQDLGIPIDHYVSLNFDTFQSVVDDLGGIRMYFPVPLKDAYSALNVAQPGCQPLNGFQALAVVRSRHLYYLQNGSWQYDGQGDLSRIQRDQEFLRILAAQVSRKGLSNPLTANALLGSVTPKLEVDSGFSLAEMVSMALSFHGVNPNAVPTYTLPVIEDPNSYYYKGANLGSVVFPSQPGDQATIDQFLTQSPPPTAPAGTTMQLLNGSGRGDAGAVAGQLAKYGFQVTGTGYAQAVGNPAETVITYAPGHLAAAQQLLSYLSGSAALAQGQTPPGDDLVLTLGSTMSVNPPPAPATSTPTTAAPATTAPGSTASNPAGQVTPAQQPLPTFDPTACPAH